MAGGGNARRLAGGVRTRAGARAGAGGGVEVAKGAASSSPGARRPSSTASTMSANAELEEADRRANRCHARGPHPGSVQCVTVIGHAPSGPTWTRQRCRGPSGPQRPPPGTWPCSTTRCEPAHGSGTGQERSCSQPNPTGPSTAGPSRAWRPSPSSTYCCTRLSPTRRRRRSCAGGPGAPPPCTSGSLSFGASVVAGAEAYEPTAAAAPHHPGRTQQTPESVTTFSRHSGRNWFAPVSKDRSVVSPLWNGRCD